MEPRAFAELTTDEGKELVALDRIERVKSCKVPNNEFVTRVVLASGKILYVTETYDHVCALIQSRRLEGSDTAGTQSLRFPRTVVSLAHLWAHQPSVWKDGVQLEIGVYWATAVHPVSGEPDWTKPRQEVVASSIYPTRGMVRVWARQAQEEPRLREISARNAFISSFGQPLALPSFPGPPL